MNRDRVDSLLEEALAQGAIPPGATPEERAELESLLASAQRLAAARTGLSEEMRAALPAARARFQRFTAREGATATPQNRAKTWLRRVSGTHRALVLAGSACAVGILAVITVFAFQAASSTTPNANAEVLNVNDYAQAEGVVTGISSSSGTSQLAVQTTFGPVSVTLDPSVTISDNGQSVPASALHTGQRVSLGGVVTGTSAMQVHTVVIEANGVTTPATRPSQELKQTSPGVKGRVIAFVVAPDGKSARVLVDAAGKSYVVSIGGEAVDRLLERSTNALGTSVEVVPGATPGVYDLRVTSPSGSAAALMGIRGVVVARVANVLVVRTASGDYRVAIRPSTRIVIGRSSITMQEVRDGRAVIGHVVSVAGAIGSANGRVIADVIALGPLYSPGASHSPTPSTTGVPAAS